jgi:hypothetical protein
VEAGWPITLTTLLRACAVFESSPSTALREVGHLLDGKPTTFARLARTSL